MAGLGDMKMDDKQLKDGPYYQIYDRFCNPRMTNMEKMLEVIHAKVTNGYEERIGKLEKGQARTVGYLISGFCVILGAVISIGVWM